MAACSIYYVAMPWPEHRSWPLQRCSPHPRIFTTILTCYDFNCGLGNSRNAARCWRASWTFSIPSMSQKATMWVYVPLILPKILIFDTWDHISDLPKTQYIELVSLYQYETKRRDALVFPCLIDSTFSLWSNLRWKETTTAQQTYVSHMPPSRLPHVFYASRD